MSEGIKPKYDIVYLSHKPDSWIKNGDGNIVLEVSTAGLEGRFTRKGARKMPNLQFGI